MKQTRSRLSSADKREVLFQLALRGGRVNDTVPHVDLKRSSLFSLKKAAIESGLYEKIEAEIEPVLRKRRQGLAYKFLDGIEYAIDAFAGKIPDASLKDTAIAIGIMTDKLLLLSGEPTERTEKTSVTRNLNISAELDVRVARVFRPLEGVMDGDGTDPTRKAGVVH